MTHEEVSSRTARLLQTQERIWSPLGGKCEYCFSHYVTAIFLVITRFHLLLSGAATWISLLALVWVANFYIGVFANLRLTSVTSGSKSSKDLDFAIQSARSTFRPSGLSALP